MLTKQLWFGAVAMALMTTAASALPIPMYKVVLLPANSVTMTASAATAAITGEQGGVFELGRYHLACSPLPDPTACTTSRTHAALWTNGTRVIDLNPSGYFSSALTGMTANVQVGFGSQQKPSYKQQVHAMAWLGSAHTMIDLNPSGYLGSIANGIDGFRIIGTAYMHTTNLARHQALLTHAFMWLGMDSTREMPTRGLDLNPPGYVTSEAFTAANGYEAGYASKALNSRHAYIWKGTATSGSDYHPAGYSSSYIFGLNGFQAVGAATESEGGSAHAYLWDMRTGAFGVDLHGTGFVETMATAVAGGRQVGWGELAAANGVSSYHALVWNGSAASCIDLHAFLPRGFISSKAVAIAPDGSIVGVAIDSKNVEHAVLWMPQH